MLIEGVTLKKGKGLFKGNLYLYKELDSTNAFVKDNISYYNHGDVIVANKQTMGFGRENKRWLSTLVGNNKHKQTEEFVYRKHGDLTFSVVLNAKKMMSTKDKIASHSFMPQLSALTWTRLFERFYLSATIKYPNDILINKKKIAGILTESLTTTKGRCYEIVGMGVNINATNELLQVVGQQACSLRTLGVRHHLHPWYWLVGFLQSFPFYYNLHTRANNAAFSDIFKSYTSEADFNLFFC